MKRVYKFWVHEDECILQPKYLTFASEVIDDGSDLSRMCDGHMHLKRDGSVLIFDRRPEIIPEKTSKDWKKFFKMSGAYPMTEVVSIHGYEIHLKRFDVE